MVEVLKKMAGEIDQHMDTEATGETVELVTQDAAAVATLMESVTVDSTLKPSTVKHAHGRIHAACVAGTYENLLTSSTGKALIQKSSIHLVRHAQEEIVPRSSSWMHRRILSW